MKKFFTFMMVLAVASILNVQAQVLQRERVAMPVVNNLHRASITPDANQGWWGYADNDSEMTGLGVNGADTYHCAIFIPGDHIVAGGKTIQAPFRTRCSQRFQYEGMDCQPAAFKHRRYELPSGCGRSCC